MTNSMENFSAPKMPKFHRGDVVVARIHEGNSFKVRPLVIIQNNKNNSRLTNVIVAMISSNTKFATLEPAQVLIDLNRPEGKQSGLATPSAAKCENIYTVRTARLQKIGHFSDTLMQQVDAALKVSLALK